MIDWLVELGTEIALLLWHHLQGNKGSNTYINGVKVKVTNLVHFDKPTFSFGMMLQVKYVVSLAYMK